MAADWGWELFVGIQSWGPSLADALQHLIQVYLHGKVRDQRLQKGKGPCAFWHGEKVFPKNKKIRTSVMWQSNEFLWFLPAKDLDKCTKTLNLASGSFDQTSQPNQPGSHQHLTPPVLFQEVAPSALHLERVFVRNRPRRRGHGDQEWRNGEPSTQHEGQFHDRGGGSAQRYHDTQVSWNSVPRFWMRKCHLCAAWSGFREQPPCRHLRSLNPDCSLYPESLGYLSAWFLGNFTLNIFNIKTVLHRIWANLS